MHKTSSKYLKDISSNLEEKTKFILSSIDKGDLPYIDGAIKILEIGFGGGETILNIKQKIKEKLELTIVDIYPEIVENAIKEGLNGVVANVCKLPFEDNSFSCINCSSVLHEVSSYGFKTEKGMIYGIDAIKLAIGEINRVLVVGGTFFYRDVLAPKISETKTVSYKPLLWRFFIDNFIPDFISSGPAFYKNNYKLTKNKDSYLIYGKSSFHREIQKHYLLWISNIQSIFEKKVKSYCYSKGLMARYLFIESYFLDNFKIENKVIELIKENLFEWLKREGGEHYIYLSSEQLIELCYEISEESLVIKDPQSNIDLVRKEENEYLRFIIENPEVEGKQLLHFRKR